MIKTSKLVWVIIVVIVLGGLIYKNTSPTDVIKIGVTNSLTGKYASRGEQTKHGMEMAVEEINMAGGVNGKKLVLITEDNQGDPKVAVTGVTKLLDVDKVDFILSAFTAITNAVKDVVVNRGKVMIYASTVTDIAKTSPYFFMDYYKADDHGIATAGLASKKGYTNVKYLTEISDPCKNYETAFLEEANRLGIQVVSKETFLPTETDLKTQLLKIKGGAKFDALVTCTWQHEHIMMPQMQQLGMMDIPTLHFVATFLAAAQTLEMAQLFSQNKSITTWYGFSNSEGKGNKQAEFLGKYKAKFGIDPTPDAAYSYDDIYLLAYAAEGCPTLEPACVAGMLTKADHDGAGGRVTFDNNRISQRESLMIQAINGVWQTIPQ